MTNTEGTMPEDDLPSECAEALGRFFVAWGNLEHEIEALITKVFVMVPAMRHCITAGMTMQPKLDLVRNGICTSSAILPEDVSREVIDILNGIAGLSAEYRNFLAHLIVLTSADHKGVFGAKFKRGAPTVKTIHFEASYFVEAKTRVAALRDRLRRVQGAVGDAYQSVDRYFLERATTDALRRELIRRGAD